MEGWRRWKEMTTVGAKTSRLKWRLKREKAWRKIESKWKRRKETVAWKTWTIVAETMREVFARAPVASNNARVKSIVGAAESIAKDG